MRVQLLQAIKELHKDKAMKSRSRKIVLATAAVAVFASGCTTLDAYTREEKTSTATKGALIGAAAGAVVGLISGDDAVERRQRALIGAGAQHAGQRYFCN